MKQPTQQQINAITTRQKDLLVSAGAGSGKTTVLTERVLQRVMEGEDITKFLIVTFMNSAAADIKTKLYDKLVEAYGNNPSKKHLYNQLNLISEANVCTISSYCLRLVKENFALLGISPRVRVIDEIESNLLLRRVTENLIKEGYEQESPEFFLLTDNFTGEKSDEKLVDEMMALYKTLQVVVERDVLLDECAAKLLRDAEITKNSGFFESEIGKELKNKLVPLYDELVSSSEELYNQGCTMTDDRYVANCEAVYTVCMNARNALEIDYVNFTSAARESRTTPRFDRYKCDPVLHEELKALKKDIAEALKSYEEDYCIGSDAQIAESLYLSGNIVMAIKNFINAMDADFKNAKLECSALDYADFELYALQLLETTDEEGNRVPTELCLKKQKEFVEVLIDEYQDVNPLQDRLFRLIAGGSYRFMVGDVKQSIYRFRNAYPDIFIGYKKLFPEIASAKTSKNACIFLRENFRCSETIINYVNHIFKNSTVETPFYEEYKDEWLIYPDSKREKPTREFPVVLAVAEKEKDNAKESRRNEAEYIAREILDLVHNQTNADGSRIKFSDIAVMLGVMKGFSYEYEKAFRKYGIPYKTSVSSNFLENPVISLALSALKAIDDPTDDISVCALLRSPIFNFSSQDLYRIRRAVKNTAFYYALCNLAISKGKRVLNKQYSFKKRVGAKVHIVSRCREFIKRLSSWRNESMGIPCSEFLKSFFVSSGMFSISAENSRTSLLLLYEYSTRYENSVNYGVSGFLDYIKELSSTKKEISDVASVGEGDSISFMTVHKSKGLEYKVCFIAGADKGFRGNSNAINFKRGEGIYFKLRNRENLTVYNPITNILAVEQESVQLRGEEFRKLYVALTRAKERLYITGCVEPAKLEVKYTPMTASSWMEILLYVDQMGEQPFFNRVEITSADGKAGYIPPEEKRVISPTAEMLNAIEFEYPHIASASSVAKISVSELREGLLEDDEYNRTYLSVPASRVALQPNFMANELTNFADIGTANHLFMQFCDFKAAESDVRAEAERLLNKRMITKEQYNLLDFKALTKFFECELYKRIKASDTVYREKRFSVRQSFSHLPEPIIVQGVIDCFFRNPDGSYTVVDYKTDRVKSFDELAKRHRVQLDCYKDAVERMTGERVSEVVLYSFALGESGSV